MREKGRRASSWGGEISKGKRDRSSCQEAGRQWGTEKETFVHKLMHGFFDLGGREDRRCGEKRSKQGRDQDTTLSKGGDRSIVERNMMGKRKPGRLLGKRIAFRAGKRKTLVSALEGAGGTTQRKGSAQREEVTRKKMRLSAMARRKGKKKGKNLST